METYWLGRAPYRPTWELQERLRQKVQAGGPEVLLLCEHDPVITLGRSAQEGDVLVDEATLSRLNIERIETNRGGQVTYHGPGQLVAYPIRRLRPGVLRHVLELGEAAVALSRGLGVPAEFSRDKVGVFVGGRKLAAIGVNVQRRVTVHGLALNVNAEATRPFRQALFHPCGEAGGQVTSLMEELPAGAAPLLCGDLVEPFAQAICRAFGEPVGPITAFTNVSLLSRLPSVE